MKKYKGIGASSGFAKAKTFVINEVKIDFDNYVYTSAKEEKDLFDNSVNIAVKQIEDLAEKAKINIGEEQAEIFQAHILIAKDPDFISKVEAKIVDGVDAANAVKKISKEFYDVFSNIDDEYMRERAADISDVSQRIIKIIKGVNIINLSSIDEEVIVISSDLTPSETSQLNPKFVKGFLTAVGGKTSHSSIIARSLEIPAVVGAGNSIMNIENDKVIIIDGIEGIAYVEPTKELSDEIQEKFSKYEIKQKNLIKYRSAESKTLDGWETDIVANIGTPDDLPSVKKFGAEGIGLFRSEFLYMNSSNWPTEDAQFEAYKEVVENMNPKRVVIRTLDIGGDKKLDYFEFEKEDNPFLGYRAIRFQLDNQEIFDTQMRALLRASYFGKLAINVPMITTIDEIVEVRKRINNLKENLLSEGKKVGEFELGIMVEVPATVILADKFAEIIDFFSIGSNDLIQYTMAADRMSESVSYLYQPFNPSILRMIKITIEQSHLKGKWTEVCGEVASDPRMTPLLVGMGLDGFSMSSSSIPEVREIISKVNKSDCEKLINEAVEMSTSSEVESLVDKFLLKNNIL